MNRFWVFVIGIGTLAISWFAFSQICRWFGMTDPALFAAMIVISVLVHELCHFSVLENYGIKCFMVFLVIMGGVLPQSAYEEKYKNLEWRKKIRVSLVGVAGNLLLVLAGCLLYLFGLLSAHNLNRLVDLNASLVVFNLLPLGILDGGRFMKILFDNAPSYFDVQHFRKMAITVVVSAVISVFLFSSQTFFLFTWLFIIGLLKKERVCLWEEGNNGGMTRKEFAAWGMAYVGLIVLGLTISSFTTWTK